MSDELKPCHRCGKAAEHGDRYDGQQTVTDYGACRCSNRYCPESGFNYDVEIWNTRPIEDALREQIKVAVAALDSISKYPLGHHAPYKESREALAKIRGEK